MSSTKCKNCGCSEIDVDPARGDVVCTGCGSVLESSIIVSAVQFEDNAHGGSTAIGQFVASDSKGGARGFGGTFHTGLGVESREITLRNAKKKITDLAHQMRLNQHCIEIAFNFFKMALSRHLTRGRKTGNVVAACVYMTCRIEGTAHMLIDFCDVLDTVSVYELGRTYLRLSQALCINIPALDPCLYILRFANRLEFGEKTHEVSMTALRLVQRMKRDSMHSGRRPSGLCGAALLMAARLHEFSRTTSDIIKIVKVHESTLRKRLLEFGETPSSSLSLDEFMTVDLEEEQDPPSFKAARKKDHEERLHKIIDGEEIGQNLTDLQKEIEQELEEAIMKKRPGLKRKLDLDEELLQCVDDPEPQEGRGERAQAEAGAGEFIQPTMDSLGLTVTPTTETSTPSAQQQQSEELITDDLDDNELDQYILTARETTFKDNLWMKVNQGYLQQQKEKEEKLAKDRKEGKPEKKRKKYGTKRSKNAIIASTAGEAIEKMLQEKKMSTKINYEVLRSLTLGPPDEPSEQKVAVKSSDSSAKEEGEAGDEEENKAKHKGPGAGEKADADNYEEEFLEETEQQAEVDKSELSLLQMLQKHMDTGEGEDEAEYYDGAEDYEEDY